MTSKAISQPSARTFSVDDLVKQVRQGRVRIPAFQRPLRWQFEDVRRLFDSIIKGYPVGSLLLWKHEAPAATIRLGAMRIDAPQLAEAWWVVDGQQRLTSLASALGEEGALDERFKLAYDLKTEQFARLPEGEVAHVLPLHTLFDLTKLLRWFADHPELGSHLDDASRITKAIREYTIPAYIVEQEDEDVLRDIFDRMNNYGRRLSRAEVFSALHPGSRESLEPRSRFGDIINTVETELGFGQLDDDTVLRAVLARRGGDVTRQIRDEFDERLRKARDFGHESEEDAYREGEKAIHRAIRFLQSEVGVPHFAFLPYRYLLVVLTRFFAHFAQPHARNVELVKRWFWRAAMIGPGVFSGSWTYAMRDLASRITANDEDGSIQRLLEAPISNSIPQPNLKRFRTNRADSRVALCAMWAQRPRSPRTGEVYSADSLSEAIPSGQTVAAVVGRVFRREPVAQVGWVSNRILCMEGDPADVAGEFLHGPSLGMTTDAFQSVLQSHLLNSALVNLLVRGEVATFLDERQKVIEGAVAQFLGREAGSEFEDTPPLDNLELDDDEDGDPDEERD